MGISTDDPQSIIRLGTIHSWLFKGSLWAMPILFAWLISSVLTHDRDIAVLKMQISMMGGSKGSVSQNVNVGQTDPDTTTDLVDTTRDYLTTADVAKRVTPPVTERAVLDWIAAGRIQPQPIKTGKAWTIAKNFRILPNDSECCGDPPNLE